MAIEQNEILISGEDLILKKLPLGKKIEIKADMDYKKKKMAQLFNEAYEVFPLVAETKFEQYTLFIVPMLGEVFWVNRNRENIVYESERIILVNKKNPYLRHIAFEDGVFYPTYRRFLLNGYSISGDGYKSIKFKDSNGMLFIPRLHQLIALFGFGEITLDAIGGKGCKATINHIDGNKSKSALPNLEIGTYSHNSKHYQKFIREREMIVVRDGEYEFADWLSDHESVMD